MQQAGVLGELPFDEKPTDGISIVSIAMPRGANNVHTGCNSPSASHPDHHTLYCRERAIAFRHMQKAGDGRTPGTVNSICRIVPGRRWAASHRRGLTKPALARQGHLLSDEIGSNVVQRSRMQPVTTTELRSSSAQAFCCHTIAWVAHS